MHSFLFCIISSFVLSSITISEGTYAPIAVTIEEEQLMVANIQMYINDKGILIDNIILACPPKSPDEDNINEKSYTKNSLIVRQVLKKDSVHVEKSENNICEKEIMPSSILDSPNRIYRIGYEIIDSYNLIEEKLDKMERPQFFHGDFHWVQTYTVTIKIQDRQAVLYSLFLMNQKSVFSPPDLCKKFEALENEAVDKHILDINQKMNNAKALLTKVYLAEPEDFDNYYSKLSTCLKVNVSAMWESVYNAAWKTVSEFIRHIRKDLLLKGQMGLIKTIDGALNDPTNEESKSLMWAPQTAVPNSFWTLVFFESKEDNTTTYGMFLIIHNNINEKMNKMCEENVCKKYGWKVENDDFHTGETYCCEPSKFNTEKDVMHGFKNYIPLDLTKLL